MAIFSLHIQPIMRSRGQSAVAGAAYRSASKLYDERLGVWWDYTAKRGVLHTEIVLPAKAAKQDLNWARDRSVLWNAAEAAEKRKDSRVAREYLVALPHELSAEARLDLARQYSQMLADRFQVVADFAIHKPGKDGDHRNFHAHIYTTTRELTPAGFGAKSIAEYDRRQRAAAHIMTGEEEFKELRDLWASFANQKLAEFGFEARIDSRTLEAQGIEREPTKHLGLAISGILERGEHSIVVERWDLEAQERLVRARERGIKERELGGLDGSILDLTTGISAALAARENAKRKGLDQSFGPSLSAEQRHEPEKKLTLEEIRTRARENWTAYRKDPLEMGLDGEADPDKDPDKEKDKAKSKGKGFGRDRPDDDFSL